jgi:polysaccharide biosynthesis protein VpsM
MTTKRYLALLTSLAAVPVFAAPFLAIGDNAELFLTGRAEARFEDNVTLAEDNEVSDEIFEVTPGFEILFGKSSLLRGTFAVSNRIVTYSDNTQLNNNLPSASLSATYEGARVNYSAALSYARENQNTRDVNNVGVDSLRETYSGSLKADMSLTEKSKVGTGISYSETTYDSAAYSDQQSYSLPVNYYFAIRPKIDLSAGFQYRKTDTDFGGGSSEDYYYNVGARGSFTPKLSGSFDTGYTVRKPETGSSEGTFTFNSGLSYAYSEKTAFTLDLSRDFDTAADASSLETTSVQIGASTQFSSAWSANVSVGYQMIDYVATDRSDDYLTLSLGVSYTLNEYVSFNGGYSLADNDSSVGGSSFIANTFRLSANFRY